MPLIPPVPPVPLLSPRVLWRFAVELLSFCRSLELSCLSSLSLPLPLEYPTVRKLTLHQLESFPPQTSREAYVGSGANDSNVLQLSLSCEIKHAHHAGICGGAADVADDKDLITFEQVPLCDISSGRIQVVETWTSCLSWKSHRPLWMLIQGQPTNLVGQRGRGLCSGRVPLGKLCFMSKYIPCLRRCPVS